MSHVWINVVCYCLPQGFDILIVAVVVGEEEGAQGLAPVGAVIILSDGNKDQKNFFFFFRDGHIDLVRFLKSLLYRG